MQRGLVIPKMPNAKAHGPPRLAQLHARLPIRLNKCPGMERLI